MKPIRTGIPQGSVLGPVIYSIYVNELSEVICDKENCSDSIHQDRNDLFGDSCDKCGNVTNYADDSTVHIASKHRNTVQLLLVQKLDKLKEFLTANRLTINVSKTVIMEILLKQKRSKLKGQPPTLLINTDKGNKLIETKTECYLLGGYLQYNMSWQSMIETGDKSILKKI